MTLRTHVHSLYWIIGSSLGSTGLAAGPTPAMQTQKYLFQGQTEILVRVPSQDLLINASCWQKRNSCIALQKLPQASLAAVQGDLVGGRNPGSAVCQKLGGESVLGMDARKNENSFCKFTDGSLISSGSLHERARENDLKLAPGG